MKKQAAVSLSLLALVAITGCGDDEASSKMTKEEKETATINSDANTNNQDDQTVEHTPTEPDHDEVCAFCNMKIFGNGDVMGAFTTQAITAEGERVFFDDSGCLLNAERQEEHKFAQAWVRDLETMEWKTDEEVTIVKADIETPMKYGYAFFGDRQTAEQYVSENTVLNATITDWATIDAVAYERYKKKMENTNHNSSHSESNHQQSGSSH